LEEKNNNMRIIRKINLILKIFNRIMEDMTFNLVVMITKNKEEKIIHIQIYLVKKLEVIKIEISKDLIK